MSKTLVQEQFGATAKHYITSKPHAQGKSLARMVELAQPQPTWHAVDIATGAGHTAYAFAPHVARQWATDITDEMLDIVRDEAAKRSLKNVRTAYAKAEGLPFEDASIDLVTCRIAPHHFDSIPAFLDETHRVLKPGGIFVVVDNVVPGGTVGDYINAFERFRDPSHLRAWATDEWATALREHNFKITHQEELPKSMDFSSWAGRHDATMQALLRSMLIETTPEVKAVIKPDAKAGQLTFWLTEALFVAQRN
ncbi:MAG TPA: methyltransferase domain-containing protein [Xanthobacteraceae bacterium]|jgi:ubiquinone/menaquinone biosynthesis C-methylase UbiE|nr:methyltransferase domain-containing protein [Xanthobacteraceae bacterium]